MASYDLDLLVIGGGGSGGFTAATTALKTGAKVGMAESGRLGGLCILAGCMPSKTLLHSAEEFFLSGVNALAQQPLVLDRKHQAVNHLAGLREKAVAMKKQAGLEVYEGLASFKDPHTVEVGGKAISAKNLVIATGSTWIRPQTPGLEEAGYLVTDTFLELAELPKSLIVLGGGAIALELSQYALRMGVETTIIQRSQTVMSRESHRVGELIAESLRAEGAKVYTGTKLVKVEQTPQGKTVHFEHQGQMVSISAQEIMAAQGRRPNTDGLNLEAAGVETRRGAVVVDKQLRTSQPHIFAAGDVNGVNMVVNLAIMQGQVAGYNASHDTPRDIDDRVVPQAVFTEPQFARVGMSAAQLEEKGIKFVEADYDLSGLGVSRTYPKPPQGFIIMRASVEDKRIVGAEMVAPHASLMIHDTAVAMKLGGSPRDLAELPYVHPCLAELTNSCARRLASKLAKA